MCVCKCFSNKKETNVLDVEIWASYWLKPHGVTGMHESWFWSLDLNLPALQDKHSRSLDLRYSAKIITMWYVWAHFGCYIFTIYIEEQCYDNYVSKQNISSCIQSNFLHIFCSYKIQNLSVVESLYINKNCKKIKRSSQLENSNS